VNYNEMTAAQCADWLAEKDGWSKEIDTDGQVSWVQHREKWLNDERAINLTRQYVHPMPLKLDAAAGALREPWDWDYIEWWEDGTEASVRNMETGKKLAHLAPDELTARYRAAVAARMEEER